MTELSPILLFTYKRLDTLMLTIDALKMNFLAKDSELYIFSDAAKDSRDEPVIELVRTYLKSINGFKNIYIIEAGHNLGLAKSVIDGVTNIINRYGSVIVLEDDLITTPNFLNYMNHALSYYASDDSIYSIAGYTSRITNPSQDVYFTKRSSSWGWGTWKNRWINVNWDVKDYASLSNDSNFKSSFNKMGSDMFKMLKNQMLGNIDSWAIRWCYNQYLLQTFTVYPTISKVQNIGTGSSATHTQDRFNRFYTPLDNSGKIEFEFGSKPVLEPYYLKQFLIQFSLFTRIKYKILNKFT